jgi:hypothetical protein
MAKHNYERSRLIEILRERPHIGYACKKVGISRMTFYRWMKDIASFRDEVSDAMEQGRSIWTEIAEAALLKNVKEGRSGDIKYYLSNNSPTYMSEKKRPENKRELTDEQIIELREILVRSRPIKEEKMKAIMHAMRAWGILDEKTHFGKQFWEMKRRVDEEQKKQKKWHELKD